MRILVVTTSYPRWSGDAAGGFVADLKRALRTAGHRIEVLAAGEGQKPLTQSLDGVPVTRIPSSLFYQGGAPDALALGIAPWLSALRFSGLLAAQIWHRVQRADLILSHWLAPSGLLAQLLAQGRPHVAIAHSSDVHLLRRLGVAAVVRLLARHARLIYTSETLRVPHAPGAVVPMGIFSQALHIDDHERATLRAARPSTVPTLLFLGRLVPVKGLLTLFSALDELPDIRLLVAGDGPMAPALRHAARPLGQRVQFVGTVDPVQRRALFSQSDALVVPSLILADGRTEGAPQVILEGLAAGLPVVASAVGGIPALLGAAGWLVSPGDPSSLAQAIREALRAEKAAVARVAQAQAALFDWARLAPQILGPFWGLPSRQPDLWPAPT